MLLRMSPSGQVATCPSVPSPDPGIDLLEAMGSRRFHTILADPPWRFQNRTGKVAPEYRRLSRYQTLSLEEIAALPVAADAAGAGDRGGDPGRTAAGGVAAK